MSFRLPPFPEKKSPAKFYFFVIKSFYRLFVLKFLNFFNHLELRSVRDDKDYAQINVFTDSSYMVKNNIGNTKTTYEICSELTITIPEQPD